MILQVFVRKKFLNLNFTCVCPEEIFSTFFWICRGKFFNFPPLANIFGKKFYFPELKIYPGRTEFLCAALDARIVLFAQFDWLFSSGYPCTIHLRTKTKWLPVSFRLQTSNFFTKRCSSLYLCVEVSFKTILMNKTIKVVNTILFTIAGAACNTNCLFPLFFGHFCFAMCMLYAKL